MQQHIGYAEQIGKGLFLNSVNAVIKLLLSRSVRYLLGELSQPRSDKSTGAAGEVCHLFAQLRLYHQCHKLGDCSRRVEFTGGTGRLQLPQNLLIDKTKGMAFLHIVNNILFPVLKGNDVKDGDAVLYEGIKVTPDTPIKKAIVKSTFEDAIFSPNCGFIISAKNSVTALGV